MRKMILFLLIFAGSLIVLTTKNITPSTARTLTSTSNFGIYLVSNGKLVLSDKDISAYFEKTHEIQLNESGIKKWNSYISYDSSLRPPIPKLGGLYKKEFAVKIDGKEIYRGRFWSSASSQSYDGIVILDVLFPCDSLRNKIRIQYGYPVSLRTRENDPLNNADILNYFSSKGLLK